MVEIDSGETVEKDLKVGTPWTILPIKNKKQAKDLVQVHLSDRGLTSLERFDEFPNLEVIWLNNNEVSWQTVCLVLSGLGGNCLLLIK